LLENLTLQINHRDRTRLYNDKTKAFVLVPQSSKVHLEENRYELCHLTSATWTRIGLSSIN